MGLRATQPKTLQAGIGLLETLIGVAVFVLLSLGVLSLVVVIVRTALHSEREVTALALATEQIEIVRALSYDDVCTVSQGPNCQLPDHWGGNPDAATLLVRGGRQYRVGTIVQTMNGTNEDYKKVEVHVEWDTPGDGKRDIRLVTYVSLAVSQLLPEITVRGKGQEIVDGDTTPSVTDATDFHTVAVGGSPTAHDFTIQNEGSVDLSLSTAPPVIVSGAHASDFSVTAQPSTPIAAGMEQIFTISFAPAGSGVRTAQVSIGNTDTNEDPYTFVIQGTGTVGEPNITVSGNGTFQDTPIDGLPYGANRTEHFLVQNDGTGDLVLTGPVSLSNSHFFHFTVVQQPESPIAPGASSPVIIKYHPTNDGWYQHFATINVPSNDPDQPNYQFPMVGHIVDPPFPTLDFSITIPSLGEFYEGNGSIAVPAGSDMQFDWTSSGAQVCTNWDGQNSALSGSDVVTASVSRTYLIQCVHVPNGNVQRSFNVTVE